MSYRILIDLSHGQQVEFPEFTLGEEHYELEYIDKNEGPIDFDQFEETDILFLGSSQPFYTLYETILRLAATPPKTFFCFLVDEFR